MLEVIDNQQEISPNDALVALINSNDRAKTLANLSFKVSEGLLDPKAVLVRWKQVEALGKDIMKDNGILQAFDSDFQKLGGTTIEIYGYKIESFKTKEWDYSECNDPSLKEMKDEIIELNNRISDLKKRVEEREATLENAAIYNANEVNTSRWITFLIEETGEIVKLPTFSWKVNRKFTEIKPRKNGSKK